MYKLIKYYSICLSILLFTIIINSCERDWSPISIKEIDPNYPTTLYPLITEEWQQLQDEFDVLNDYKILTKLNQYGFTGGEYDYSKRHPNPHIKLTENEALQIAISTIVKNKEFTNVTDSTTAMSCVRSARSGLFGDSTNWSVYIDPQKYNGYEVLFSWIDVRLYGDGVYSLSGFWYNNIYIPPDDNVSSKLAKILVLGQKLIWSGAVGDIHEFIVTESTIGDEIDKVIVPIRKEEKIELRVTWQIPIMFYDWIGWYLYVDTTDGEIVIKRQLFIT